MKHKSFGAVIAAAVLVVCRSAYSEPMSTYEAMNLATMLEAQSTAFAALNSVSGIDPGEKAVFSGSYSDSGWSTVVTGTMKGYPVFLSMSGQLSGSYGSNIDIAFSGSGFFNSHPMEFSQGQSAWSWDAASASYKTNTFQQLGLVDNPVWAWVVGAQAAWVILRAGVEVYENGWRPGAVMDAAGEAALAAVGVSTFARFFQKAVPGALPPTPPPFPGYPNSPELVDNPGAIYYEFDDDGLGFASEPGVLTTFTAVNGVISGEILITPVPEPSTYAIALSGLAFGGFSVWRRRKRS